MTAHAAPGEWRLADRVDVSGGEVAAGVLGNGAPVILVHGTPASAYLWRKVAPVLAREYRVYVWDLLGFGASRLRPGVPPSIAQQARTLAELVEHWALDTPVLVGHDIGGGIVLRAHLIERVPAHRLALLDAAVIGPWNTPFTEHMQRHADVYRTMPTHVFADIIRPRIRTAVHRPMPDEVLNAYLAPWTETAGQQRWIDQVASVSFEDTREVVARLDEISAPTLVLWGEHDEWFPPTMGEELAAAIPGAKLLAVAGAGHFLPEDNPEDTADALLQFLGE